MRSSPTDSRNDNRDDRVAVSPECDASVQGSSRGSVPGVIGTSQIGNGVQGVTNMTYGVYGTTTATLTDDGVTTAAVYGEDNSAGGTASNPGVGVLGFSPTGVGVCARTSIGTALSVEGPSNFDGEMIATSIDAIAISARSVTARTAGTGTGMTGSSATGIGVLAESTEGTALRVSGKLELSRSGQASVPAGAEAATVQLSGVTSASLVIATAQGPSGAVAVANVTPAEGSFTINLTAEAAAALKVAWIVVD
jgi:hypothetical protein